MKYGLSNEEAIHAIKSNYPPENYTVLREALDMATNALQQLTEKDAIIDVLVGQITDETAISAKAIVEQDRLRKALDEARKYPRQPNNEGGWTIKSEFLAEVSEMTEDGEYCSMEQVENVLLCAEWLLGEGDMQKVTVTLHNRGYEKHELDFGEGDKE